MKRLVWIYKNWAAPVITALLRARGLEGQCKFHPTCSEYALGAVELHGPVRGSLLAAWRVLRCHPFSSGGVDLVPAPSSHVRTFQTLR
ncbi:MAG: membrane protein insertion efficiency factor YidD [Acidobacteriales bacterium]|nr:membrane protein insertion efficiency factor YidD [Terriglobales bacterium]